MATTNGKKAAAEIEKAEIQDALLMAFRELSPESAQKLLMTGQFQRVADRARLDRLGIHGRLAADTKIQLAKAF